MKAQRLTIEEYNLEIELAEEDIKNGDVYTNAEVSAIISEWRRKKMYLIRQHQL